MTAGLNSLTNRALVVVVYLQVDCSIGPILKSSFDFLFGGLAQ
jgi:predicted homoserine dehydrogenase-like protein